jgi:hypothetical protein
MKYLFGFNAVPIAICLAAALGSTSARAGCAIEQTASNEIIIRTSVGGNCNGTALREGLSSMVMAGDVVPVATVSSAARPVGLSDIKRSSGQGALWRLANMNNQAGLTSLTMPGGH